jgi:dolichol-phosphate mannosyltransferase
MIYIILPAYNEEKSLATLLYRIRSAMEVRSLECTIILVNDGSQDNTLDIAQRQSQLVPMEIINHEQNRGLGEALKSGLVRASKIARDQDAIITMDADNTHSPDLIKSMISRLGDGYDCVIASRYVSGGEEIGLSLYRKVLSRGASALVKTVFPISGVRDYTCGYRAYKGAIIKEAFETYGSMFVQEEGFTCMVEVLLKLRKLAANCCEVPLTLRYDYKDSPSKMRVARTIVRYFVLTVQNLTTPKTVPFRNISPKRAISSLADRLPETAFANTSTNL